MDGPKDKHFSRRGAETLRNHESSVQILWSRTHHLPLLFRCPLRPVCRTPADRPASLRDISSVFPPLRRKIKLMDGPKDKHFSRRGAEALRNHESSVQSLWSRTHHLPLSFFAVLCALSAGHQQTGLRLCAIFLLSFSRRGA